MKKILSIIIVVLLFTSLCVSAFADGTVYVSISPSAAAGNITPSDPAKHYSDSNDQPYDATANLGYEFLGWQTEDSFYPGPSGSIAFTTDKDRYVTAMFIASDYTVQVSADPAGAGSVSGGGSFHYNDTTTISAVPNPGYDFVGWTGNVPANPASQNLTIKQNVMAVAHFKGQDHIISASVDPAGSGYVNSASSLTQTVTYDGTVFPIKAQPVTGYQFDGWYEGGSKISTTADEIFDIDRDRVLVAKFVPAGSPGPAPVDPDPGPGPGPAPDPGPYPYKEFKITYHPGVYGAEPAVQDTAYPGIGWLRGTTFTRPGYIHAGWSWDPYGKEFNAALNAPMPMLYENITVYPYWEPIKGPLVLTVGYSGSGAIQVNGRYVYNGENFTIRPGESLTFGFYPASGNYVYSVLLAGRYREYPGYGFTVNYDMMQNRNQTLAVRFESVYTRPKTGDDSNIGLWLALGMCSAVCLGVLVFVKKKK
ncbi:MAG: InlB B-repeat-containing protein [Oscillospiraceae bacterium]|nr:InlB B-repeat-containing protein [Oscillospiraceae bacterium]